MKLPSLKIGKFEVPIPIIQGGMSVRLSTPKLAAAVSNANSNAGTTNGNIIQPFLQKH